MVNAEMEPDSRLATYKKRPSGSAAIEYGSVPTVYGDPLISVNSPLLDEIEYAETFPPLEFATYKKPLEDTETAIGLSPAGKGEAATGVNAPLAESIEYTEISFDPMLAANRNLPAESIAKAEGSVPAVVREEASVRAPVLESIVKSEMFPPPSLAT